MTKMIHLMSKNSRVLVSNMLSLGILQVVGYVFPLLTMPYLAHVLGVNNIGKIAFASAIIIFFQTLVDYGFNFTATRDVAKQRDDKTLLSDIYSSVMCCKLLLLLVAAIILLLLIIIIPTIREEWKLFLATFLMLPGYIMFPEWFFQGLEQMKYITILNIISKLLFTVAVFIFIDTANDYVLQPLLTSIGFILSGIIAMYIIHKKIKVNLHWVPIRQTIATLKGSTDVFLNQLAPNLYNSFSVMLLGFFWGAKANGLFEAGNKLISIVDRLLNVISRAFFPYLSRNINKHSIYVKLHFSLTCLAAIILFIFASYFIRIMFSDEFIEAVWVLRILSISIVFLSLSHIFGVNYLIITGNDRLLRNITIKMSLLGFIISVPLVYYFGFIGAATTILITRLLIGLNTYLKANSIKNNYNHD